MLTFDIGNINPGVVRAEYMNSIMKLMSTPCSDDAKFQQYLTKDSGPYLDTGRNFICERFMQGESDVLLFVDSDIEFEPEQAFNLVSQVGEHVPVIGGCYANSFPQIGVRPVAFKWFDSDPVQPIMRPIQFGRGLTKVDTVGTGFMAIHRSLLEKMFTVYGNPSPYFAEEVFYGSAMGEDVTFCQRVIHHFQLPICVNFDIQVNHIKPVLITPSTRITHDG